MNRFFSLLFVSALGIALVACDDGTPGGTDAGGGGADAGPGAMDSGTGDPDAGPGETDAGPGETDAGPGETDAGASDAGDVDAGPMLPPGACTNADDDAALGMIDTAMEATRCGNRCFGGAMCVTMCMEDLGISNGCATCFGAVANCTAMNCALMCARGDSPACTECRRMAGCIDDFEMCSGLPGT